MQQLNVYPCQSSSTHSHPFYATVNRVRQWLVAYSVPIHCLNQHWLIVNLGCCISLSKSCLYFCFVQCFLHQLACSSWVSGSVPLRRGRDNAVAVQWRWPAAVAPRSCSQESGSNALVGRLCRARRAVLGFEFVLPGIMRPLSYPPTLRVVLRHTRMWVQWCHWWLIYILNELSIFHIILFESLML